MAESDIDPVDVNWENPETCPWCGADIEDGGPGFMEHVESNPECQEAFEAWRENVSSDIGGEWMAD